MEIKCLDETSHRRRMNLNPLEDAFLLAAAHYEVTFSITFFMLNSAEHEIFSAYKYENANNSWYFHIY